MRLATETQVNETDTSGAIVDAQQPGDAGSAARRVRWAHRVRRESVRRLYVTYASGIVDTDQIDEVGFGLLARCESILKVTDAARGRVHCPACSMIELHDSDPDTILRCDGCGWTMPWHNYHKTYKGQKLYAGGAEEAFRGYVDRFEQARTPDARMLTIDWLLHRFHAELSEWPTAPAARNLIEGNIQEIVDLLNALAYG